MYIFNIRTSLSMWDPAT